VCRTYNFGDIGSSSGQYFRLFLKPIKLNHGGGLVKCSRTYTRYSTCRFMKVSICNFHDTSAFFYAENIRWDKMDMSYLQRDNYARMFAAELAAASPLESVGAFFCLLLLRAVVAPNVEMVSRPAGRLELNKFCIEKHAAQCPCN